MLFERRPAKRPGLVLLLLAATALGGCLHENERVRIPPASEAQSQADLGLGPGVRPLSSGPGEKGSPSWSPSGEQVAFTVDGYVAQKRPTDRDFRRRTTKDFDIESVAWTYSGEGLAILGENRTQNAGEQPPEDRSVAPPIMSLYRTAAEEESLDVVQTAPGVRAIAPDPNNEGVLLARKSGGSGSRLSFAGAGGEVRAYAGGVPGGVTGISFSPSGEDAAMAVWMPGRGVFELRLLSFPEGGSRRLASLDKGLEVLGAPQIAENGAVYFVAGERPRRDERGEQDAASYSLYQVAPGTREPELVSSVGNDFVASSLERDPEGKRLAVIGRRNTSSPANLYVLDVASNELEAATSNEEMEVKTGPEDLDWSPDGSSVTIVARTASPELEVHPTPVDNLVPDFYNLYEVPVVETPENDTS